MIVAGIDIGSLSGKVVIMEDDTILSWSINATRPDSVETAREVMEQALRKAGISQHDIEYIASNRII